MVQAIVIWLVCFIAVSAPAQDTTTPQPSPTPTTEEVEKQKAEQEKNAYRLLDQIVDEAQSLRLPENRVRIQLTAADMLWERNQARARTLFAQAADTVAEMGRQEPTQNQRGGPPDRRAFQLRQELVLTAARHDAPLAYQLLATTKPPASTQTSTDQRGPRLPANSEDNLEQTLLGRIAVIDPKMAGQNAEQMMEKGQFPRTLPQVINQLQNQDADAAARLADKTLKKIQAANILTNNEAATLAQSLLTPGPRLPASSTTSTDTSAKPAAAQGPIGVLDQSIYTDLLSSVVDAALKATPQTQNAQRGANAQRGRGPGGGVGPGQTPTPPTDAQVEQANARRLLNSLQATLPVIDQLLPSKATLVRQKMTELGMSSETSRQNMVQAFNSLQGNANADALIQAAASAPPQLQNRIYQQAAYKAIEEGNSDRARQIATDHLQASARDAVMKRIDFKEMSKKADGARLEEIRQTLSKLQSDNDRIELLLSLASDLQTSNPKVALQFLDEAKQIALRRATNYDQFEQQMKVAHAYAAIDPTRSFEVLEPGIIQLNELLSAAQVLSGFEINIFRDGEMSFQAGSGLTSTITRYGQELALLAKSDFERSEMLAGRFQFTEPRIMTRLAIVQGLLGVRNNQTGPTIIRAPGQPFTVRQD